MTTYSSKNLKKLEKWAKDGKPRTVITKSFSDSSKSFVTPDFSDKSTWFYSAIEVDDEIAIDSGDQIIYTFASGKTVIDLDKITNRDDWKSKGIIVKKNDIEITTGFSVNCSSKQIIFDSANQGSDIIKVSYSYENGSTYILTADSGKVLNMNTVEAQFSAGVTFNDILRYELILNNPSTSDTDVIAKIMDYKSPQDFLNISNGGRVLEPFGGFTSKINIFFWDYLTGFILKPVGDATTNPYKNEFNKLRISLIQDEPYTNCEIATATMYCKIEDL